MVKYKILVTSKTTILYSKNLGTHQLSHSTSFFSAEWRHPDLERHQKLRFSRQYILHHDSRAILSVTPVGMPAEIHNLYVKHLCFFMSFSFRSSCSAYFIILFYLNQFTWSPISQIQLLFADKD